MKNSDTAKTIALIKALGGGGSGGSDSTVMFVGWRNEYDPDLGTVIVVDKTAEEIMEFMDDGKAVVLVNGSLYQYDYDPSADMCFTYSTVFGWHGTVTKLLTCILKYTDGVGWSYSEEEVILEDHGG